MHLVPKLKSKLVRRYETMNLITVSRSAILYNFDLISNIHKLPLIPVLKANAYGHGLEEVSSVLKARKFPLIAVDGYFEALKIRQVSKQPVLVMGSIGTNNINSLRTKNVSFVVFSKQSFATVKKSRRKLNIHLEVNTGMNRHGLSLNELREILAELPQYPKLNIEGAMTHLSSADEVKQDSSAKQFQQFKKALDLIHFSGLQPKYVHVTNSAGTAKKIPEYITAVRPGIALYGINTLTKTDPFYKRLSKLKPALTLTSRIDQIVSVKSGDTVGYNRTYEAAGLAQIATIPIGYYEGVPRSLSNKTFVTANSVLLPTTGTICMNHTMFNCSNTDLKVGDEVTLISSVPGAPNSIVNLRANYNVFEYSLPTGLRSTIRRRIVS